ncbi:MAG: amino acid permease [Vulcanimicrobiaceae bacterium]
MSVMQRLFATTNIEKLHKLGERKLLKRVLGGRDLVAIGLGTMIGGGIFTTIGPGVAKAGPAVIVAYVLAATASFFAALCYAELGSIVPIAGSAYTYAYATLGQVIAWIIGWDLILEYGVSAAPVAQQWSAYFQDALHKMFGWSLPAWAASAKYVYSGPWWHMDFTRTHVDVLGAIFVVMLSGLLAIGIRETATSNNAFVVIKIAALLVFIVAGLFLFHPQNLHPFTPLGWITGGAGGLGIVPAAALVFFSYIGFDTATTAAEETKNPKRDIPYGVLGSLLIGTILYCAVAFVLIGAVPWQHVDQNAALAVALRPLHSSLLEWIIIIGALAGTTSVALTSLFGQSRIFYVMARDNMLPQFVATIHPRFRTPARMTMITGFLVAILTLIVPLDWLLELVNIGTFSAFIIVCAGVIFLRYKRPDLERKFRSPFVPVFPIIGIVLSAFLATQGLGQYTWWRFFGWLAVGLVIYFAYGFRKSDPDRIDVVPEPQAFTVSS